MLGASGFLPLFGGPGYEAALVAGVVLPLCAAIATSIEIAKNPDVTPFDAFGRGVASGFLLALVGLALSFLHGLRIGFCDLGEGVALFVLAPGFGAVLGGAWGAAAGILASAIEGARPALFERRRVRRALLRVALALSAPLVAVAISFWRFLSSPMVFAFDPFFGYFAGPLYDTVIEPLDRLESYRVGSLFTLLAAGVLFFHLERPLLVVRRGRPGIALAGALAALGSLTLNLYGSKLGHWSTTATIRAELERTLTTERCSIVYAPSIPEREAAILGRECDAHVRAIENWFETKHPERITAFIFESEAQKGRLMGAASTYIAKPWRNEVYVQFARYPHPVLGHELAHVVSGGFARGPFRVAGPLGGWFPDPGRIEGVAVASTPSDDPEFTQQEWARAMLDLGLLPPVASVFKLSFLGENSSKAYTVAGAFVEWLKGRYGAAAVRGWYASQPIESVTGGKDLQVLDREWRDDLLRLALPPKALETARARFDRPAIFARKCPHTVDRLLAEAGGRLGQGDFRGAKQSFEKVLALDSENFGARIGLGSCATRAGDEAEARRRWGELSQDPKIHKLLRLAADEAIADLDLARGNLEPARERYKKIAEVVADEDRLRTLDVKSEPGSEIGRAAIASLLVGDPRWGRDFGEAAAKIGGWAGLETDNGLPEYLLGRNFYLNGRYEEAAQRLDSALSKKLALGRVEAEAVRVRLVVGCALEDRATAKNALARWRALPNREPGANAAVERIAERCGVN